MEEAFRITNATLLDSLRERATLPYPEYTSLYIFAKSTADSAVSMANKKAKADIGDMADNIFERLPDSLVLKVFSKLAHVGHALRAASVCRRFCALVTQMEKLAIDFDKFPKSESRKRQDLAVGLLLARSATGALKDVTFSATTMGFFYQESVLFWIAALSLSIECLGIEGEVSAGDLDCRLEAASHCPRLTRFFHFGSKRLVMSPAVASSCRGGFRRLEVLQLRGVSTTGEAISELVSLCPRLKWLQLEGLAGVKQLELTSSTIEYVALNVSLEWGEDLDGFQDVRLVMPALDTLSLGDLEGSLIVEDASLEALDLSGVSKEAVINLGSKANLYSLQIELDRWPPNSYYQSGRTTYPFSRFMSVLKHSKPGSLRVLTMPSIDDSEQLTWTQAQDVFRHIAGLWVFGFHGSFAAALGFGVSSMESNIEQVRQLVQGLSFRDLHTVNFYLDVGIPASFELVEIMAKSSPVLRSVTVFADSEGVGFELPGSFISRVMDFQHSNSQIKVDIRLPDKLRGPNNW